MLTTVSPGQGVCVCVCVCTWPVLYLAMEKSGHLGSDPLVLSVAGDTTVNKYG